MSTLQRIAATVALLATSGLTALAQEAPCTTPLRVAPDIRGLSLGMGMDEVRKQFKPDSSPYKWDTKPDEAGVVELDLWMLFDWVELEGRYKGVRRFLLSFTDSKLSKIGAVYEKNAEWPNVEAFTEQISKTLALPNYAWQKPASVAPKKNRFMMCDGFKVVASIDAGGSYLIGLVDLKAEQTERERRAVIADKKRQAFKP